MRLSTVRPVPFFQSIMDNIANGKPAQHLDDPAHAAGAAQQRQAALGLFARKMTHDLNNFATVVRTYSELLQAELPPGSSVHADAAEIHRAADAMVMYLQRMVHFARATNARARAIDADRATHDAVQTFKQSELDTATLPVRFAGVTGAHINVDPAWFTDTMTALLCNAREASPAHEAVTVTVAIRRTDADTSSYVITVADLGAGFDDAVSANAEDPFVTTKRGERGAGFGLTSASAYARSAGGYLAYDRVHGETHVSLVLPCVQQGGVQ